jgi:hypothetical protein
MLLQVATPAFQDVFQSLFQDISQIFHERVVPSFDIVFLVQGMFDKVQKQLLDRTASSGTADFKFLLVLDEAQVLGRLHNNMFLNGDRITTRPPLAPVLHAFRRIAKERDENKVCVMPCGTGLSYFDLVWAGGSAYGQKLSGAEYEAAMKASMILDFPGWTREDDVSSYVKRLGHGLSGHARTRLARLFPSDGIHELFRDYHGRFRPIISIIEDIIETDDLLKWR